MLLAKDKKEVPDALRMANFQAHDGTLTAKNLVLDTAPVLIAGEGFVHLGERDLGPDLARLPQACANFSIALADRD